MMRIILPGNVPHSPITTVPAAYHERAARIEVSAGSASYALYQNPQVAGLLDP